MLALIGSLLENYTATDYSNGETPKIGATYHDLSNGRKYRFIYNNGASSIAAQEIAMALTTDKRNWYCSLSATTDALRPFAGVRPTGADTLLTLEYGWIQVGGPAIFTHSGGQATAAEEGIVSSATTAGRVEGEATGPFTIASHPGVFAVAEAAVTAAAADVKGNIERCMFGF